MKYIIVEDNGLEQPLVFSELLTHGDVADPWRRVDRIVSAGFCTRGRDSVEPGYRCYGESVSLGIRSRGALDEEILNRHLL